MTKRKEWFKRYAPAEVISTSIALILAWSVYTQSHSYVAATAAGWFGEGVGFYGYFLTTELLFHAKKYAQYPIFKRISLAVATAGAGLFVEFLPAELLDNFIIRPFAMYEAPHYIHPYPIGFLAGKFSADVLFYALAVIGYEVRKALLRR